MSTPVEIARDAARWQFCLLHGFPTLHQAGSHYIIWADSIKGFHGGFGITPSLAVDDAMIKNGVALV